MLLTSVHAWSQQQLVRRSASDNILRIDPRGNLPDNINDPLPFIARTPRASVIEKEPVAIYFFADENGDWKQNHIEIKQRNAQSGETTTLLLNDEFPKGYEKTIASSDSIGRPILSTTYTCTSSNWNPAFRREWKYDGMLLQNKSEAVYLNNFWIISDSLSNEIIKDNLGNILRIISRGTTNGATITTTQYDFDYQKNQLTSITFSSLDELSGKRNPFYKYDEFVFGKKPWDLVSYSCSDFSTGKWTKVNSISNSTNGNYSLHFLNSLLKLNNDISDIENIIDFDDKLNLKSFVQRQFIATKQQWDTAGCLRFNINYQHNSNSPKEIVTSYFADGAYHPSMKVVFAKEENETIGISTIGIYPNPVSDHAVLFWNSKLTGGGMLQLFNAKGELVQNDKISDLSFGMYTIATSGLTSGVYTVKLNHSDVTLSGRMVVVN